MKLTDKAIEEFKDFLHKTGKENLIDDFESIDIVVKNALIIEWFDSVGIYIEININQITDKKKEVPNCFFEGVIFHVKHKTKEGRTLTYANVNTSRQEATEKAIEKANLIYNKRV